MKKRTLFFLFVAFLAVAGGCRPTPSPTIIPATPTLTAPVSSPTPVGKTILVTNAADSGPGTLRQALQDAQMGDTITFDPSVFLPEAPETITVTSGLRQISQGNLTIDASDAGVILDGSQLSRDTWIPGLEIVSDANTIRGMQVINFTGTGIVVAFHGQNNTIGGDRNIGAGPIGQGNLTSSNDFGIGLWDSASNNTVIGNLVGTDVSGIGNMGNRSSGIWVETGTKNMIGPNNVIAHNARCGIQVEGPSSVGNTLSQNIIHNNNESGICMIGGGNMSIAAPLILGFDLQAGSVEGLTCPNCIVEVFSDNEDEGMTYEGQALADIEGSFIFSKGTSFSNSYITMTATDSEGNTSTFSTPTTGTKKSISLQQENNIPLTLLSPKYSQELLDNHIGVHTEGYDRYSDIVEHVYKNGFKWIRIQSLTEFWDDANDYKTFTLETIPPSVDRVISEYAANGVNIVLDLWMGAGLRPFGTTFQSEEEISRFSDYVRFVVSHFKGRIHYYEIWNEPGVAIAPSDYVNLVRQVVPVIQEEDPDARIIIGAIEGSWEKGYPGYGDYWRISLKIGYLKEILLSGVASLVDGISWHPFYENIPSDPYYQDYPQIVQGIKELAVAQGFRGEYFADELLWGTQTLFVIPPNTGPQVSPWVAAKYYTRAIALHRGLGVNVTINTYFQGSTLSPIHNINNILAGAEPTDISMSISNEVASIQQYAFSLPNGDRLVALWTNGEAVEDDPGVNTTLTFPSTSAQKVIGIDVLHGFEQELITETENGDLVIRNLLVKDYPIILRLTE